MLTGGRIIFPVVGTYAYWLAVKSGQLAEAATWTLSLVPLLALGLVVLFRWFDPREGQGRERPASPPRRAAPARRRLPPLPPPFPPGAVPEDAARGRVRP